MKMKRRDQKGTSDFPNVVHMMKLIHFEGVLGEVLGHVSWEFKCCRVGMLHFLVVDPQELVTCDVSSSKLRKI